MAGGKHDAVPYAYTVRLGYDLKVKKSVKAVRMAALLDSLVYLLICADHAINTESVSRSEARLMPKLL